MKVCRNSFSLVVLSLVLFFTQNSFSQGFEPISKKGTFNVGLEGGIQFTSLRSYYSYYEPFSKIGFSSGVFGEYYLSNSFKVKLAILYDYRPFELNGSLPFPDTANQQLSNSYYLYQVAYKMNYLTIPFGIGYERGNDKFKIVLQFNFYYSILLNSSMNGGELYYFDPKDGFDLSYSSLHQGLNEFQLSGKTEGVSFTDISKEPAEPYRVDIFNTSDFGFNFMIGGLYQATPTFGISLSFGFSYSLGRVFEDPEVDSKWQQITKINLGLVYSFLKK